VPLGGGSDFGGIAGGGGLVEWSECVVCVNNVGGGICTCNYYKNESERASG